MIVKMPDSTATKEKQFTLDCKDTVHAVKFSQLEFLTDLLAIGTTRRLSIVKCSAKVYLRMLLKPLTPIALGKRDG